MNTPMITRILALTLCLAILPATTSADVDQDGMKGLTGVQVAIESFDHDAGAQKLGISEDELKGDVELKLRLAGMKILNMAQAVNGTAILYVNVNVINNGSAASVSVELRQDVHLYRDPSVLVANAMTWGKSSLLTYPTRSSIRNQVKDQIDQFLNAWLTVNPKTR